MRVYKFLPSYYAVVSGILWSLASPLWSLTFLAFVVLVPLAWNSMGSRSNTYLLKEGFWCQIVFCIGTFFWIPQSMYTLWNSPLFINIIIFFILSSFSQLPVVFFPLLVNKLNLSKFPYLKIIAAATIFSLAESIYPKLLNDTYGDFFAHQSNVLSYFNFSYGTIVLTFLVVIGNLVIALFLKNGVWRSAAVTWIILLAFIYFLPERRINSTRNRPLEVISINFNFPVSEIVSEAGTKKAYDTIIETLDSLPPANEIPRLVVLPETVYPLNILDRDHPGNRHLEKIILKKDLHVLLGSQVINGNQKFNAISYIRSVNSQIKIDYNPKQLLFPFGERIPLIDDINFLKNTIGPTREYSVPTIASQNFSIHGFKVGTAICYESIFPWFIRKMPEGLDLVINNTNESFFPNRGEPELSFALTVLASVENNIPIVRTSNAGIGGLIDDFKAKDYIKIQDRVVIRTYQILL